MKNSLTLIEMIIAMVLMSIVALAAISFDFASREFFDTSSTQVTVLNELTYVLQYFEKDVLKGIGDIDNPAITVISAAGVFTIAIRQDNPAGYNPTPWDYGDDTTITWVFDQPNHFVTREVNSDGPIVISNMLVDDNDNPAMNIVLNSEIQVIMDTLIFRLDPLQPLGRVRGAGDNPEAFINFQHFFPLSQSLS